jgi:hypothetical protein
MEMKEKNVIVERSQFQKPYVSSKQSTWHFRQGLRSEQISFRGWKSKGIQRGAMIYMRFLHEVHVGK